jgi:uncharacterized protein (DUF433 family)
MNMEEQQPFKAYKEFKWIVVDPQVLWGTPCVRGTRLHVSQILECLSVGMTPLEIEEDYPGFPKECIPEILKFAAEIVKAKNVAA